MNDVISDDVTIVHILMKFFRLSLGKNEILVSKMELFIFNWRKAAILILNVTIVTSSYARHSLNARNELLAGNVFF